MSSVCHLPIKPLQPKDVDRLLQQRIYRHVLCVDIPLFLDGRLPPILQCSKALTCIFSLATWIFIKHLFAPSDASPTSQLILKPFLCFTYVTAHSPALLSLLLCHRLFTYVTWRATHYVGLTHNTNARGSDACRGSTNLDQNNRQIHKGGRP